MNERHQRNEPPKRSHMRGSDMRAHIRKDQRLRLVRGWLDAWTWLRGIGIAAAVGVAYLSAAELSNSFLITPETVIFGLPRAFPRAS